MTTHRACYYEARLALGLPSLLPVLGLPLCALFYALSRRTGMPVNPSDLATPLEVILPLAAALAAAPLMVLEREEGFGELRATYAEHRYHLPLVRTASSLGLIGLGAMISLVGFWLGIGPYALWDAIMPSLAPTLWLMALALLIGNVSGSYWVAAGGTTGYWLFELMTRSVYTKSIFLFDYTWPHTGGVDYGANRWLLAGLGLAALVANGYLSAYRRTGRRVPKGGFR